MKASPELQELFKAKAPGAWTEEGVPLPGPLVDAVEMMLRNRPEALAQIQQTQTTNRVKAEWSSFKTYLLNRLFAESRSTRAFFSYLSLHPVSPIPLSLLIQALLSKVITFLSYTGAWSTPFFCNNLLIHWQDQRQQGEQASEDWSIGLIIHGAFIATSLANLASKAVEAKSIKNGMMPILAFVFNISLIIATVIGWFFV